MTDEKRQALAEFKRIMKWTVVLALKMVLGAIGYLAATGDLTTHMFIATFFCVFFSMLLGCGLFAAAFFSDKKRTRSDRDGRRSAERTALVLARS